MIEIIDKAKCCGCNACVQKCPKQCIYMHEDEEGFLYPKVEIDFCIDCHLCEKVCPVLNQNEIKTPIQVCASRNANEKQRLRSSSGGIFILLAEQTIKQGGVVFGARFDDNWDVEHCYAETLEELKPLMRSKYVQSRIGDTYKQTEDFLKQGRKVLFVGTSCQIAGLKRFLCKEYENLLAVDFICHGVPSPGVWHKYLEEIKSEHSESIGKNSVFPCSLKPIPEIKGINFREKQLGGYSWENFGFVVQKTASIGDNNSVLLSVSYKDDLYMKGFLGNLFLRPSCYSCPAKSGKAGGDITIADFWAVDRFCSELNDKKGVSLILLHTEKGKSQYNDLGIDSITLNYDKVIGPRHVYKIPARKVKSRKKFWKQLSSGKSLHSSIERALKKSLLDIVGTFCRRCYIKLQIIIENRRI